MQQNPVDPVVGVPPDMTLVVAELATGRRGFLEKTVELECFGELVDSREAVVGDNADIVVARLVPRVAETAGKLRG